MATSGRLGRHGDARRSVTRPDRETGLDDRRDQRRPLRGRQSAPGWKEEEWLAYGYGFPPIGERMSTSRSISRSSRGCSAWPRVVRGQHVHVRDAINEPCGIRSVSRRWSAAMVRVARPASSSVRRRAELRLHRPGDDRTHGRGARPVRGGRGTRRRCASRGRSATRTSVRGRERVDLIGAFAATGVDRPAALRRARADA